MRLNAWLARAGVASRRGADELIKAGRVTVNGEPGQLNTLVQRVGRSAPRRLAAREADALLRPSPQAGRRRHDRERPAGPHDRRRPRRASEPRRSRSGASTSTRPARSLLTNDGELAHRLAHPRYEVDKVYDVEVWAQPTDATCASCAEGVKLDDGPTAPAQVRRLDGATHRADDPRGPQPAGEAHARGGRASREDAPSQRVRPADARRARARRMARARALRGGASTDGYDAGFATASA